MEKDGLKITVSKEPVEGGVMMIRQKSIRERLLQFLLGPKLKLMILVPGDSVEEVEIRKIERP